MDHWVNFQRLIFTALVCAFQVAPSTAQGEDRNDAYAFNEQVSVELDSKSRFIEVIGSYLTLAEFEDLPSDKEGLLKVQITNPETFALPIKQVKASCGCTKAELMGDVIPAGGTIDLKVKIKTPKQHKTAEFTGLISLEIDQERAKHKELRRITVQLKFTIDGLLCFNDRLVTTTVPVNQESQLELPLVCTLSTVPDQLKVEAFGDLAGVDGKLVASESGHSIRLSIDSSLMDSTRAFGWITITDPATKLSDRVNIVLNTEQPIQISPQTIRFRRSEEDSFTATAIVRVRRDEDDNESNNEPEKKALALECKLGSDHVETKVTPVNSQVYRVQFSISESQYDSTKNRKESDSKPLFQWRITTGMVKANGTLPYVFRD